MKDDDHIPMTPQQASEFYGERTQAFMKDIVDACRRHDIWAVAVVAVSAETGPISFSTGTDHDWRKITKTIAALMGEEMGKALKREVRTHGPLNLTRK